MELLSLKQFTVLHDSGISLETLRTLPHEVAWWIIHCFVDGTDGDPTLSRGTEMDLDRIERLAQYGIPDRISRRLSTRAAVACLNALYDQRQEWKQVRPSENVSCS